MAKFLTNIDLTNNEIRNFVVQNLGTAPTGRAGLTYYDTSLATLRTYNGTAWVNLDATKATNIPMAALAVDPTLRSNHTGTQLASTISNLAATVQAYTLNQFAAPTANIPMNGFTLTGLAAPTATGQAATWDYVNAQVQSSAAGISSKPAVQVVSTANVATLSGLPTVDGITLTAGQRVLLTNQTTNTQNGVWLVASGAWTRPTTDAQNELDIGALWLVEQGTAYAGTQWRLSTPVSGPITPGTTAIGVVQFSAGSSYTAGNGLTLTNGTFAVGAGTGIAVSTGTTSVDTSVVVRKYAATITGDATTTAFTVTHNLNNTSPVVAVYENAGNALVVADIAATTANTITVTFGAAPANGIVYRVACQG